MSIVDKIMTNVKDRIAAVGIIKDSTVETAGKSTEHLKKIEPVQAVLTMVEGAGNGVIRFLKKQCEITRRWI